MTEENERLDPEEIAELASTKFKTEIKRRVVIDDDGCEWGTTDETRKTQTPAGEIITDRKEMVSRFLSCGHQMTDPTDVARCEYNGHFVCRNCITQCNGRLELVCVYHSDEYEYNGQILRLCQDCAEILEYQIRRENTLTQKVLRLIRSIF